MVNKLDFSDVRIIIIDDQPVGVSGLQSLLLSRFEGCCIFTASSAEQGFELVSQHSGLGNTNTLVLLDLMMPGREGMLFLQQAQGMSPRNSVKTVMLSGVLCQHRIADCRRAGAAGYIAKTESIEDQLSGIALAIEGKFRFYVGETKDIHPAIIALAKIPPSLLKVYDLVCEGKSNQGIADILGLSISTVKQYNSKLMTALNVSSRAEMITISQRSNALISEEKFRYGNYFSGAKERVERTPNN
jgi:DNA-binding NarL/FixJ family response regulator